MAELFETPKPYTSTGAHGKLIYFVVTLDERDEMDRARRILRAAVLQINDRIGGGRG